MRLSPLDLQWVLNAEFLPLAAVTLVAGALGDRFGQKRIFLAGIALYGLGATAVAFAPSFALLIVGRFLQRLDGTLILPNGHSVLGHAFSADKKARAVGIWSAAAAVAGGVARARRDRRSRVQADDLSDAPARSRRRWPCPGRRWWRIFSTVGLGGLGAGLTNRSGLNLWVLVTLIIGLGGLAGLTVTERPLGDNAMLPRPSSPRRRGSALRSVHGHANLDPVRDHSGRAPADAGGGPSLHSLASADYGRLAAHRHALSPVRPALAIVRRRRCRRLGIRHDAPSSGRTRPIGRTSPSPILLLRLA